MNVLNRLFRVFLSPGYMALVYIAIIIAFIIVLAKILARLDVKDKLLKAVYFVIFLPALAIPFIKCHFKVPFVFCRACPRKCVFGELRPFIIPSFILLNLDKRFWCYKLCPCGTVQEYQAKACKKRIRLPGWLINIRYAILAFVIVMVSLLIMDERFRNPFFIGRYSIVAGTAIAASIIFLLCFFIPRFWCRYICPVGSFSDVVDKIGSGIRKKKQG
ncbi:4Fe-4S binding protein, partial [Candidatus Woesearchaeota archaeon]|nr:4Fe-4S binding protein [Candidatus Woesearchaeota archaeon]